MTVVTCSDDGTSIRELHLGNRGLTGALPDSETVWANLPDLRYLMLAHNALTGPLPSGLNYSQFSDCGYGEGGQDCCYFTALVSGVYDTANETGVTNVWDCPLPDGAATACHAACAPSLSEAAGQLASKRQLLQEQQEEEEEEGAALPAAATAGAAAAAAAVAVMKPLSLPLLSPRTGGLRLSKPLAAVVEELERHHLHAKKRDQAPLGKGGAGAEEEPSDDGACQQCVPASPDEYPQCDVDNLIWDHISAAYCTADHLIVWANAMPNHVSSRSVDASSAGKRENSQRFFCHRPFHD